MWQKLKKISTLRLLLLLVIAGASAYLLLVVVITVTRWHHEDGVNAARLKILRADRLFQCDVPGLSPFREKEEINADTAGSTHGIGFGGRTLTSVTRMFALNGSNLESAIKTLKGCAEASGWKLTQRPYVALGGVKTFPGGWTADLNVYIISHESIFEQPIIQIKLTTDPI